MFLEALSPAGYPLVACVVPVLVLAVILAVTMRNRRSKDMVSMFEAAKILETLESAVFVADREGYVRIANRAFCALLGCAQAELVGKQLSSLKYFLPTVNGFSWNSEFRGRTMRCISKDGKEMDANISSSAVEDRGGHGGFVYTVSQASEINKMNKALKESRGLLEEILDNSMTVIYLKDTLGRFILVNRRFETLFHVDREELIGKTDYDVFSKEAADTFRENDTKALRNGTPLLVEEVSPHDDGMHTYVSIKFPVHDARGAVSGICGIATDITIRKLAEELLKESEERFRSVAQTASDAIVMSDNAGKIIFWNKSAQKIFGYLEAQIAEKPFTALLPERFRPVDWAGFERYLSTGESDVIGRVAEMRGLRKDGSEFPMELSLSTWLTNKGRFFSGIIRDISDRRRAQEILMEKTVELARANAEREQMELFTYVASHDLREPLQKIIGFGDLLVSSCGNALTDKGKDYLQRIQAATMRIDQLISDLLRFSKLTTEKAEPAAVPLSETLKEALSDLEVRIKESKAVVDAGELPIVYADRAQMRHVFQNLISNALKFCRKGEPPHITIRSRSLAGDRVEVSVADKGIGFDETYLEKIFKPFERLHSRSEYEGSGLGLAICQKILRRLGGTITAKSSVGHGATFILTLPTEAVS